MTSITVYLCDAVGCEDRTRNPDADKWSVRPYEGVWMHFCPAHA